ncbi:serine/threonine protein kinase [Quadrisphaera granulorum]|uniref:non-specific serine/threonine protein kinase n=1 Tax=Quadrisphaera granulorum TaxID=317664 RepID=A0A316A8H0_9ACTN|nr:serine/threonine-protein kinase [Quadrisphaera granulorum]PWJ53802.1 serine/threonine-protein kinase [Quadrisphaera granulorum]SZE96559.1 serine/threonine protein kinase [Quadrisphaera granulorum]
MIPWDREAEVLARLSQERRDLLAPGQVIGGRLVLGLLGRGGTAQVYRVLRGAGHGAREEALKVLEPTAAASETGRQRFHRECEVAAQVRHPGVVAVLGHGEELPRGSDLDAPLLWAAMELLDGGTSAVLRPRGRERPDVPRILDVLAQAAAGLDAVHAVDVVHGDVKPTNVLLAAPPDRRAAVTDFGLARSLDESRPLARHGRVAGSLPYAAPELLQALRVTSATDVYSLACTAVELLSGEPPYPYATRFAVTRAHLAGRAPKLSRRRRWLPTALDRAVAHGLAVDPAERPPSCSALVEELAAALT